MNRLSQLQAKKMMKELEYLNSELDWKNEIISEADGKFMCNVNEFLDQHPDLKEEFDKVMDRRMAETVRIATERAENLGAESDQPVGHESDVAAKEVNPKVKRVYREIVKKTHPDKVDDPKLNQLYIDACKFYDGGDLFSLYSLYGQLGMDYDVDEEDLDELSSRIDHVRERIGIIEAATTWVWYNADDEAFRNNIIVKYIIAQIR